MPLTEHFVHLFATSLICRYNGEVASPLGQLKISSKTTFDSFQLSGMTIGRIHETTQTSVNYGVLLRKTISSGLGEYLEKKKNTTRSVE